MKIDETKVWTFHLPLLGTTVSISIPGATQPEAAKVLKNWMDEAQKELALLFPQVSPVQIATEVPPTELNALQIGLISDLVTQIPGRESTIGLKEIEKAVKELTELDLNLENVKIIIPKLEALKHGKKKA